MKVLLVGGGTGGHIFPLRNLADELVTQKADVELLVAEAPLDRRIAKQNFSDITTHFLRTGKIRRYFSLKNFVAPFIILQSIFAARKILRKNKPDVLFFKGGFVGFPILVAAKLFGFRGKIVSHESDISPGALTLLVRKFAHQHFESFGKTPTPLFFETKKKTAPKKASPTPPGGKILFLGGSQGANFLNILCKNHVRQLVKTRHVTVITGVGKAVNFRHKNFEQYELLPAEELSRRLKHADLVISRAGANTLFEVIAAKKPSIVIPLPSSARNHQWKNAQFFAQKNLCRVFPQNSRKSFLKAVTAAQKDHQMKTALQKSQIKNAAGKIAETILNFEKKN
ncbi:MAG: glycosyltransferase [Candidatus Gracilibacteria bacterium]|nr:glycosyltransferase [Candidatus Gracilibacteria bacterium]